MVFMVDCRQCGRDFRALLMFFHASLDTHVFSCYGACFQIWEYKLCILDIGFSMVIVPDRILVYYYFTIFKIVFLLLLGHCMV